MFRGRRESTKAFIKTLEQEDEKKLHTEIKEAKAQRLEVGSFNEPTVS